MPAHMTVKEEKEDAKYAPFKMLPAHTQWQEQLVAKVGGYYSVIE